MPRAFQPRRRGFTLIEVLIVLVVVAILIAMAAMLTRGVTAAQKRSVTAARMATVDAALIQFVMLQKRLPCPADGAIASGVAGAGVEIAPNAAAGCNAQVRGVVPWTTLGISETDATDGWDRRLTYRVSAILGLPGPPTGTATNVMDLSWCDPAGTAFPAPNGTCLNTCAAGAMGACTSPANFLNGKGLTVQNVAGTVIMSPPATGAAYVVISHGETGGGAYLNSGVLATSTTTDGNQEQVNYANLAPQAYYVDDGISEGAGPAHFDDLVSRPTILTVANKAGLGPRAH